MSNTVKRRNKPAFDKGKKHIDRDARVAAQPRGGRRGRLIRERDAEKHVRGEGLDAVLIAGGEEARKRTCNRHDDCDAVDERFKAKSLPLPVDLHCHDEDCEDCFGK